LGTEILERFPPESMKSEIGIRAVYLDIHFVVYQNRPRDHNFNAFDSNASSANSVKLEYVKQAKAPLSETH